MNEPEKFLDRWSRRKREAAEEPVPAKDVAAPPAPAEEKPAVEEKPFHPASLPPVESIKADTDISAFLKPGVPPELSRAALRQAWSADPAIRDFIGPVENGWDFNDPNAMPGFGSIESSEVARLLAQAIGQAPEPPPVQKVATAEQLQSPADVSDATQALPQDQVASKQVSEGTAEALTLGGNVDIASQNNSGEQEDLRPSRPRGHGGALPK
jgi:uncharacterized protein DUF3306